MISDKREEYLDGLVEKLNEIGQWEYEYNTENEDNVYADYCGWGWKESELYLDGLDSDARPLADVLAILIPDSREFEEALVSCAEISFTDGYWANRNEIFSCAVGEFEISLDSEEGAKVQAEIAKLTDEEWKYVDRQADYCPRNRDCEYMRGYSDGRWSLIVCEDMLAERVKEELEKQIDPKLVPHLETIADALGVS